jgi:hypothetical protein
MIRASKYGAKKAVYGGHLYHSAKEAAYAFDLDLRLKAGEIYAWERQIIVPMLVNGRKVCSYIVDFLVKYPNGHEQWVEVKGYETPEAKLKMKLFRACFPERDFLVVR